VNGCVRLLLINGILYLFWFFVGAKNLGVCVCVCVCVCVGVCVCVCGKKEVCTWSVCFIVRTLNCAAAVLSRRPTKLNAKREKRIHTRIHKRSKVK
jgi:hypothetical protein